MVQAFEQPLFEDNEKQTKDQYGANKTQSNNYQNSRVCLKLAQNGMKTNMQQSKTQSTSQNSKVRLERAQKQHARGNNSESH